MATNDEVTKSVVTRIGGQCEANSETESSYSFSNSNSMEDENSRSNVFHNHDNHDEQESTVAALAAREQHLSLSDLSSASSPSASSSSLPIPGSVRLQRIMEGYARAGGDDEAPAPTADVTIASVNHHDEHHNSFTRRNHHHHHHHHHPTGRDRFSHLTMTPTALRQQNPVTTTTTISASEPAPQAYRLDPRYRKKLAAAAAAAASSSLLQLSSPQDSRHPPDQDSSTLTMTTNTTTTCENEEDEEDAELQRPGAYAVQGMGVGGLPDWATNHNNNNRIIGRVSEGSGSSTEDRRKQEEESSLPYHRGLSFVWPVFLLALTIVSGGVVGRIVAEFTMRRQESVQAASPTTVDTVPDESVDERMSRLQQTLIDIFSTMHDDDRAAGDSYSPQAWEDPTSPQSKALYWLVHTDTDHHQHPQEHQQHSWTTSNEAQIRLETRYALAVLYFATNGTTHWQDSNDFLSHLHHECDWTTRVGRIQGGILCQDSNSEGVRFVTSIDLGK
jgi:hypothetical protein